MSFLKTSLAMAIFITSMLTQAAQTRPNIVLILADDVSPDMFSAFGQEGAASTPNIDKLAAKGVMFKTAYATAKCASSRVEIMTGRYANTTGVYVNEIWMGDSRHNVYSDNIPFSKMLKDAGYATAITGKWHAGVQMPYEDVLAFDEYALWESSKYIAALAGSPKFTGLMEDHKTTSRYWHPGFVKNGKLMATKPSDYSLDIEADFIMEFMEKNVKANKPFLAYWPTVAPHGTRTGMPTNPLRGKQGSLAAEEGDEKNEDEVRFKSLIEYLDLKVGEVVAKVESLGISDNTIIIFTSDNGTAVTAKTRGVERGSHVVHIAAGAGVIKRGATDELTDLSDITPTLIDLAQAWDHVPEGHKFDGKSLKNFYTGKTDEHRDWIYGYAATSQLFRTKNYMLEVVNPVMGMPNGRFYYTADNRFGHGYILADGNPEHAKARAKFDSFMAQLPAITKEHPHWKTKTGKKVLKSLAKPAVKEKHLYNHRDYKRYDETYTDN
ncbi:sulfatase-like hydrolase/transferase [Thalassotalea crassostreae]|uniref:sulfatase-like hydrolase/transferase n=1 Tax=Thalassotalea crassostreae TaxID=1763536 RepID=UPI000839314D|nr:sulfatase-like hydrolase/transferase [Thalassotalea crassostreae]